MASAVRRLPVLLSSLLFLLPTPVPAAAERLSGQQEFLEQVRSARREAKGKILLGKREAMVAWERARLFIYTHAKKGSVTDRGDRISGRIVPFTWTARQRLKKGRVEIEPLCQSSRLFRIDDARGRMTEGRWRERWTLRRCGRPVPYLVTYTADGYGEAMVEVGPEPSPAE